MSAGAQCELHFGTRADHLLDLLEREPLELRHVVRMRGLHVDPVAMREVEDVRARAALADMFAVDIDGGIGGIDRHDSRVAGAAAGGEEQGGNENRETAQEPE